MATLKGVIFGVDRVLCDGDGNVANEVFNEIGLLFKFLSSKNITPVFLSNRHWTFSDSNRPIDVELRERWDIPVEYFEAAGDNPAKQTSQSLESIRNKFDWEPNETLLVGNTDTDMQAAVNGSTLLLTAEWYEEGIPYGFPMASPKDVAAFIDTFCLRESRWFMNIDDGALRYFTLAPFATMKDATKKAYSEDFREHVKDAVDDPDDFWAKVLCSNLYFGGEYAEIDYICSYPSHSRGDWPVILQEPMRRFATCFRSRYLTDLVYRHTTAIKSQTHRSAASHSVQLNSTHLTKLPTYVSRGKEEKQYKKSPLRSGKTVLLLDDVCTEGYSLEAGRSYLRKAGVNVICASLLKTVNRDYTAIVGDVLRGSAFVPHTVDGGIRTKTYRYHSNISNADAPEEMLKKLRSYRGWDWPE